MLISFVFFVLNFLDKLNKKKLSKCEFWNNQNFFFFLAFLLFLKTYLAITLQVLKKVKLVFTFLIFVE